MYQSSEPHGGVLVDRMATEQEAAQLRERAAGLPRIHLDARETADLELIATGAASPLTGFLGVRDYQGVLRRLRLANGTPWPVPFTLAVTLAQMAAALRESAAALQDAAGRLRGIITVSDAYVRNLRDEARALVGTDDPAHPVAKYLLSRPSGVIGGPVMVVGHAAVEPGPFTPREIRALARRRRWTGITGLATVAGQVCIEGFATSDRALLAASPIAVRHARGRDALLQAIVLKNHGAREVFLEYERDDWLGTVSRLDGEDLGVVPVLLGERPGRGSAEGARSRRHAGDPVADLTAVKSSVFMDVRPFSA